MRAERGEVIPPNEQADRRASHRWQVLWWAQMEMPEGLFPCSVFDLSPTGAKLRASQAVAAPQRLRLVMPPFGFFGAEVRWVTDAFIGLEFDHAERERIARLIASRLNEVPR